MAPSRKIYALKRIRLTGRDHEAAAGFIDEITLLQRLRGHSNIIQLIDAEVTFAILFLSVFPLDHGREESVATLQGLKTSTWSDDQYLWQRSHSHHHSPVVILNGCVSA